MRRRTTFLLAGLTILVLPIAIYWRSPMFNKNYGYIARRDVQLILDSPEVERLLTDEDSNIAEREALPSAMRRREGVEAIIEFSQHPERHFPKHLEFLRAIPRQKAEMVPNGSYARALKTSKAPCGRIPDSNIYAMFRITTGPLKNHQGWACMHVG